MGHQQDRINGKHFLLIHTECSLIYRNIMPRRHGEKKANYNHLNFSELNKIYLSIILYSVLHKLLATKYDNSFVV